MGWILMHQSELIGIATGIVTVASIVAKITVNETDNKWVGYALKILDMLALNTQPSVTKEKE